MTLPSGTITMQQVAAELGLSNVGINLNHSWVRALAGATSGAVSMGALRGQTADAVGNFAPSGSGSHLSVTPNLSFFRGVISQLSQTTGVGPTYSYSLFSGNPAINWTGNIKVTGYNGASAVLTYQGSGTWSTGPIGTQLLQSGVQSTFTFQPSN